MELKFENLEARVIRWADDRGIYATSSPERQFLKAVSEMGELADALAKGQTEEAYDAIGDTVVCLINLAHMMGTSVPECLQLAYTEIKNRQGAMVNGVFVKS